MGKTLQTTTTLKRIFARFGQNTNRPNPGHGGRKDNTGTTRWSDSDASSRGL